MNKAKGHSLPINILAYYLRSNISETRKDLAPKGTILADQRYYKGPIKASDLETYSSSAGTLRSDVKPITPLVDKESTANLNHTKTYERRAGQSV